AICWTAQRRFVVAERPAQKTRQRLLTTMQIEPSQPPAIGTRMAITCWLANYCMTRWAERLNRNNTKAAATTSPCKRSTMYLAGLTRHLILSIRGRVRPQFGPRRRLMHWAE